MTRVPPMRSPGRDAGFSLLELVVMLAIIAGAAALALPNIWRKPVDLTLRSVALDMAALMRATRADAVRANSQRAVNIDTQSKLYWSEPYRAPRAVPRDLLIEADTPKRFQTASEVGRFVFFADGSSSGGQIKLRHGASRAMITINWLTGNAEVQWQR